MSTEANSDLWVCSICGKTHYPLKYGIGDRVQALSMLPHILRDNPFGCHKIDHTGDVGTVVEARQYDRIKTTTYLVNFEPDPSLPWEAAPFEECQLQPIKTREGWNNPWVSFVW